MRQRPVNKRSRPHRPRWRCRRLNAGGQHRRLTTPQDGLLDVSEPRRPGEHAGGDGFPKRAPELRRKIGPAAVGQNASVAYGRANDANKGSGDAPFHLESIAVVGGEGDGRRRANRHEF
jgi:hypothetical protein